MQLVTVLRTNYLPLAELALGTLEVADIWAVVLDEYLVGINWTMAQALGGVRVAVHLSDAEQALELLRADVSESLSNIPEWVIPPSTDEQCPFCGSLDIIPPRV